MHSESDARPAHVVMQRLLHEEIICKLQALVQCTRQKVDEKRAKNRAEVGRRSDGADHDTGARLLHWDMKPWPRRGGSEVFEDDTDDADPLNWGWAIEQHFPSERKKKLCRTLHGNRHARRQHKSGEATTDVNVWFIQTFFSPCQRERATIGGWYMPPCFLI